MLPPQYKLSESILTKITEYQFITDNKNILPF